MSDSQTRGAPVFARSSFQTITTDGRTVSVRQGDPWEPDDEIVQRHPGAFEAAVPPHHSRIERGTRAPGETR